LAAGVVLALPVTGASASPEIPGAPQSKPIALVGGTIHPVSGPQIVSGTLLLVGGKIAAIGTDVEIPQSAERIDVSGKHIYPSLFDAYTPLGLVEVNAVRSTVDRRETGQINPNVKSWVAVNPDSELIPVARSNGVLLAVSAPLGGLISGQSAVLQLDGWTFEDMTLVPGVAMHLNWPRVSSDSGRPNASSMKQLRKLFDDARAYRQARGAENSQHPVDIRLEAMLPVLDRKQPLIISADVLSAIQGAVAFAEEQNVRVMIYGGYDAPQCAELLSKNQVPVLLSGVYRLPRRRSEPYDAPFTIAHQLHQAGVKFCITGSGRFGGSDVRNLPYHAAMAAAFGLPKDIALKSITSYPAEILGVDDRVGSLTVGKDATLFVTDGDPLETATQVEAAYIQGRRVDLNNRHTRLWKKYQTKYQRLAK
jgi:imidazolonepropionase-like amidohydrolase